MPLPMVHLMTAREAAKENKILINSPEYYLGSIAPDAIHMRNNTGQIDKAGTHFRLDESKWEKNTLDFIQRNRNRDNYNFCLGYGVHILTDIIWFNTVYINFEKKYADDPSPLQEKRWAYYNDTDGADLMLYKEELWRKDIWKLLEEAKSADVENLLTSAEIDAWNRRTLHWYENGDSAYKHPVSYITEEDIRDFSVEAGRKIIKILKRI